MATYAGAMDFAALCTSLGAGSSNQAALDVASEHLQDLGHVVSSFSDLEKVPAFRPDLAEDAPSVVAAFREALSGADGLLLSAPEYAGGLSGVAKNALDWLVGSATIYHLPVVVFSAGTTGGKFAIEQLVRTLSWQGALVVGTLGISAPRTKSNDDGLFTDEATIEAIQHLANQVVVASAAEATQRLAMVKRVVEPFGIDSARFGDL